jgi:hypothetical protein
MKNVPFMHVMMYHSVRPTHWHIYSFMQLTICADPHEGTDIEEPCTIMAAPAASIAASEEYEVNSESDSDETLVSTATDPADSFQWFVTVTHYGIGLFNEM